MTENSIIGVKFTSALRLYYFLTDIPNLKEDDKVIVETVRGIELATVSALNVSDYKTQNYGELKTVLRLATDQDLATFNSNLKKAVVALEICTNCIKESGLEMRVINCEYVLDATKVIFTYVADERVDFRDLLKSLSSKLKCRIELRQVGSRDRAKLSGGIGVCGLPVCCNRYLNNFDGISINMAKNQMIALNIQKLSGQCGKLICCLKYEDQIYSEAKTTFAKVGQIVHYNSKPYKVIGVNLVSGLVKLEHEDDIITIKNEELK